MLEPNMSKKANFSLKSVILSLLMLTFSSLASTDDNTELAPYPQVKLETSMGTIIVELNRQKAPITVANFLNYVSKGEYNNTLFHRIIKDFVVQGGGLSPDFSELPAQNAIVNESGNGLLNERGTIAMARSHHPHSASRQFYFNLEDNTQLNPSSRRWGYAVFGEVIEGMDVVQAISQVPTELNQEIKQADVPIKPVILTSVILLTD